MHTYTYMHTYMFADSMPYLRVMLRSSIVILGLISACLGSINQPWFRMMEWLRPAPWPREPPATTRPAASRNCMGLLSFGKSFGNESETETIWVVLLSVQTQHDKTNRSHSWTHAVEWISGTTEISGVPPPHGGCTAPQCFRFRQEFWEFWWVLFQERYLVSCCLRVNWC